MIKTLFFMLIAGTLAACSNSSSGGGGGLGGGGNNPQGNPPVGVCIEATQDGLGQICTEYFSGTQQLTAQEIEGACKNANINFAQVCPAGQPLISCEVKQPAYTVIYRVTAPAAQRNDWVTSCAQLGGKVL